MRIGRFATLLRCSVMVTLGLMSAAAPRALAQHHSSSHGNQTGDFVKQVREATARFRNPAVAKAEGYELAFGCVSGGDFGAMGMHFVNMPNVADGILDPERPEIVIYEPTPNGRLRLIGADFLVTKARWEELHTDGSTPQLGGQLLHLFEAPNRFGLPDFYTLHVWAWKENPTGMFVNWHANVSCESFSGQ
jgi:hypothetical protein